MDKKIIAHLKEASGAGSLEANALLLAICNEAGVVATDSAGDIARACKAQSKKGGTEFLSELNTLCTKHGKSPGNITDIINDISSGNYVNLHEGLVQRMPKEKEGVSPTGLRVMTDGPVGTTMGRGEGTEAAPIAPQNLEEIEAIVAEAQGGEGGYWGKPGVSAEVMHHNDMRHIFGPPREMSDAAWKAVADVMMAYNADRARLEMSQNEHAQLMERANLPRDGSAIVGHSEVSGTRGIFRKHHYSLSVPITADIAEEYTRNPDAAYKSMLKQSQEMHR